MRFEWDPEKNRANHRKHGVWFEEAQTAFFDDLAEVFDDPDHGQEEERFILLGLSSALRILVVVHCLRQRGEVIRIISNNRQWTRNYPVKLGLVMNPKCPPGIAIKFLNFLTDRDLGALMRSRDVPGPISVQARRILARKGK